MTELPITSSSESKDRSRISAWRDPASHARIWPVMMIGLIVDLWTKHWALATLESTPDRPGRAIEIIDGYFRFALVKNPGAVFGFAAGAREILITVSILALLFMIFLFVKSHPDHWLCHISLGMLLGGALGNIHDRVFQNGLVTDFIEVDLGFWPADPWPNFNIADSLLCVGVVLLMWHLFRLERKSRPEHSEGGAAR